MTFFLQFLFERRLFMKEKILQIIEGLIIIALGVIIAVFGGGTTLNIYFGIVAMVGGVALTVLNIVTLVKAKVLDFGATFLGSALIVVAIGLFAGYLLFDVLINLVVLLFMGLGIALILYGLYSMLMKKDMLAGICQIIIGAAAIVLSILYLAVEDFRAIFWIIVGVVVAVYGVLIIVSAFIGKKKKDEPKVEQKEEPQPEPEAEKAE